MFQPKRSAMDTSSLAPTFTPSGANTELHEWAKLSAKLPPQDSPLAFSRSTPSITALVSTGNWSPSLTFFFSSAAAVVMILNVEPGGWGAEKATPARARTSPLRGSRAAMPPSRPASASTADSCSRLSIVAFTRRTALARERPSTVRPASSVPPGVPSTRVCSARSSPLRPTGVSRAKPRA